MRRTSTPLSAGCDSNVRLRRQQRVRWVCCGCCVHLNGVDCLGGQIERHRQRRISSSEEFHSKAKRHLVSRGNEVMIDAVVALPCHYLMQASPSFELRKRNVAKDRWCFTMNNIYMLQRASEASIDSTDFIQIITRDRNRPTAKMR